MMTCASLKLHIMRSHYIPHDISQCLRHSNGINSKVAIEVNYQANVEEHDANCNINTHQMQ